VLLPVRGIAGGAFTARGSVTYASVTDVSATGVRILWDDGATVRGLKDSVVSAEGKYSLTLVVPDDAQPGVVQVCAVATGTEALGRDIGCTPFTVLSTPPAAITGVVTDQLGVALSGVDVRLTTDTGAPIATLTTGSDGTYSFTDLPPGDYLVDARCPTGGAPACSPSGDYFPPTVISLTPGATATQPLTAIPPPLDAVAQSGFGGIALPGGALSASAPVRVTNGLSGVVAHLGSLQGLGFDPLTVRFWSDVDFFDDSTRTKAVRFEILEGSVVLDSRTTYTRQPVSATDPTYAFTSYVADFITNNLPPGDLTLRITPLLGGVGVSPHEYTLQLTDLASRWFNYAVTAPALMITTDAPDDLVYTFNGTLPTPPFAFDEPRASLDNAVSLGIAIDEQFHTNATWSGNAKADARVTLLGQDLLNATHSYNGPSGASFAASTYTLDPIHRDAGDKQCISMPPLSSPFAVPECPACRLGAPCPPCWGPRVGEGMWFTAGVCIQGSMELDSTIDSDLHVNARITPSAVSSPSLELKTDAALCNGSTTVQPVATVHLPIYYDPQRTPLFGFDNPCLGLGAEIDATVGCAGVAVEHVSWEDLPVAFGCSQGISGARIQDSFAVAALSPNPSVITDGAGHALAAWIQEESSDPAQPDRRVVSSYYDGTSWTPPLNVSAQGALVDTPKVAFLGPNRVLAVWVQSTLSLEQALATDLTTLLASMELYFALWDGATWSAPAPITSDALLDTTPSLAGDPSTGQAVLVWLRAHDNWVGGGQPASIYAATFDGAQWSAPTLIGSRSTMLERAPTVKLDRHGQAVAAWWRDVDGHFLTSEDRQIVIARADLGAWSAAEAIPNLPAGAYTPSLAFDTSNNVVVAFVVPPVDVQTGKLGSGNGNRSVLYAAYQRGSTWAVAPVGTDVHAEQPVVGVNSDNHAIIMYRQFGDSGDVHVSGDLASAVADLNESPLQWTTGFLTADGQVNWEVAFDIDAATDNNVVFNVKKPSGLRPASFLWAAPVGRYAVPSRELDSRARGSHSQAASASTVNRSSARTAGGRVAANAIANGETAVASLVVPYQPDLTLAPADITFSNPHPLVGDTVTITANVHNLGLGPVGDITRGGAFTVAFYDDDGLIRRFDLLTSTLPFNTALPVSVPYTITRGGVHPITVVVDEGGAVVESDEANNSATTSLGQPPAPTDVTTTVDADRNRLSIRWQAPDTRGIREYRVYRSTTAGYELVGGTTASEFVDALAERGVTYHYVVAAVDMYGATSPLSAEVTASIAVPACVGDCNRDGAVTVDELLTGVNIALGNLPIDRCTAFDTNADGAVTIDELLTAVNNALGICTTG
jgi:hypothetical protein